MMQTEETPRPTEGESAAQEYADNQPQQVDADDMTPETAEAPETAAADDTESRINELEAALAEATEKLGLLSEQVLRAQADMDNLRKRSERDVQQAHKFALEKFINELLPVRDSLEMGVSAAQDDAADVTKLREGSELTLDTLTNVLGKFGVEVIDPIDQVFNPEQHQAVSLQPAPEGVAPNTVTAVMQKGFALNGRLIRPAMVVVAQG